MHTQTTIPQSTAPDPSLRRIMLILLSFRWLSLLPPLVALALRPSWLLALALFSAALLNTALSVQAKTQIRVTPPPPALYLVDLIFAAGLLLVSGGWQSPFTLYLWAPLLGAGLFYGLRGAITAAALLIPLYLTAVFLPAPLTPDTTPGWPVIFTMIASFFIIGSAFGYATQLLRRILHTQRHLRQSHDSLQLLYRLAERLQSAADVEAMQEAILTAVTTDIGCDRAVIGLVAADTAVLTGWIGQQRQHQPIAAGPLTHSAQIPLTADGGLVARAVRERRVQHAGDADCTDESWLKNTFSLANCTILPLMQQDEAIGVLLVQLDTAERAQRLPLLEAVAGQAGVAIGAVVGRLSRARELAVQKERLRIAQDIHDSVSQSLFGIVFTLDGSLKLLPDHPEEVMPELERALSSAEEVRAEIRHAILDLWPTKLTATRFTADLQRYASDVCHLTDVALTFDVRGDFAALSPLARRSLYRMAQESLNNIAHHAQASEARVCVDVAEGRAQLVVRDNGRGFNPAAALNRPFNRDRFGLSGIRKRAEALGGECHVFSQPGAGASLVVDIPVVDAARPAPQERAP